MKKATDNQPIPLDRSHPRHQGGFTLIEILASIAIMGMILATAGSILMITLKGRERIYKTFEQTGESISILQQMEQDLSSTYIPNVSEDRPSFYGQNNGRGQFAQDSVDFVTTRDTWDPETESFVGISECGYLLEPHPEEPGLFQLYRRSEPWIQGDPIRGGTLTRLHDRVVALEIEYAEDSQTTGFERIEWKQNWNNTETEEDLPALVRITLVLRKKQPEDQRLREETTRTYELTVPVRRQSE